MDIFISINHLYIQQICIMQCCTLGVMLGQMKDESNAVLPLRTLQPVTIISPKTQLEYRSTEKCSIKGGQTAFIEEAKGEIGV